MRAALQGEKRSSQPIDLFEIKYGNTKQKSIYCSPTTNNYIDSYHFPAGSCRYLDNKVYVYGFIDPFFCVHGQILIGMLVEILCIHLSAVETRYSAANGTTLDF